MHRVGGWVAGALALGGSVALGLACGPRSRVDGEAEIAIEGRIFDRTSAPAAGARMRLVREPSLGELLSFVANPIAVGLWCITRELEEEPGCLTFRRADTDAQGRYAMTMTGEDTQKELGAARHFWLGTAADGASIGIGFYVQDPMVRVPDVMLWDGTGTAADDGSDLRITWPAGALSPSDARVDRYSIAIEDGTGGPVWEARDLTVTELRVERAILEDVALRTLVSAHSTRSGSGTDFEIVQTAPRGSAAAGTFRPASRGASCRYRNGAGADVELTPCPITDGSFSTFVSRDDAAICEVGSDGECRGASFEEIVIDLGAIRASPRIVVHATGTPSVDRAGVSLGASADGVTWSSLGGSLTPFTEHDGPIAVRFVRLRREVAGGAASATAFTQLVNEIAID